MQTSTNFLIPHDFTEVGDSALKQGAYLAKATHSTLSLLHVVKSDKYKKDAENKLNQLKANIIEKYGEIDVKLYVMSGSIFTEIGKAAMSLKSSLVIMGTHGAKGMQKVFGSFAMKVITSCNVPFMIVQNNVIIKKIERIVLPLGIAAETLQIMGFASTLAKAFGAEVHLIAEKHTDTKFANKTKINFQVIGKQMTAVGVKYKMELIDSSGSYLSKILKYSKDNSMDIIAIAYYSESIIKTDGYAQHIITNDQNVPSLIINSKPVSSPYF